jgi:hypothetical protein
MMINIIVIIIIIDNGDADCDDDDGVPILKLDPVVLVLLLLFDLAIHIVVSNLVCSCVLPSLLMITFSSLMPVCSTTMKQ